MAAIIEPRRTSAPAHRLAPRPPARPALRLVPASGGRPVDVPLDAPLSLGLGASHLIAAVVAMAVVLVAALAIGNGTLAALAPAPPGASAAAVTADPAAPTVTVEAGDTLWTIARRLQPTGDVRPMVDQLVALNGNGPLQPGQEVVIPG